MMSYDPNSFSNGEVSYSKSDKELRDKFISEYLRDYNAYASCVRIGFMDEEAFETAKAFMEEPYVKRGIADAEDSRAKHLRVTESEDLSQLPAGFVPHNEETDKQRIVSGLFREAFYKGPGATHNSRVSALGTLAKIYKLDKEEAKDIDVIRSNVMVVPAMVSPEQWEAAAAAQQAQLKKQVTE